MYLTFSYPIPLFEHNYLRVIGSSLEEVETAKCPCIKVEKGIWKVVLVSIKPGCEEVPIHLVHVCIDNEDISIYDSTGIKKFQRLPGGNFLVPQVVKLMYLRVQLHH